MINEMGPISLINPFSFYKRIHVQLDNTIVRKLLFLCQIISVDIIRTLQTLT